MKKLLAIGGIIAAAVFFFFAARWFYEDSSSLQGLWLLVEMEQGKKRMQIDEDILIAVEFTDSEARWVQQVGKKGQELPTPYRHDPGKKPKEIDLVAPFPFWGKAALPGVYEIKGDMLLIAVGRQRPANLDDDAAVFRLTFKRLKQ